MRRTFRCARHAYLPAASLLVLLLGGCAQYAPRPLPEAARLKSDQRDLQVDTTQIDLPRLAAQRIDLNAPLDLSAVAALAVLNDPQLQVARDRAGVAQAQAFAAGLLPDPQFSASRDIPQGQSTATSSAYSLGLNIDLGRLITRGAAVAAARDQVKHVHLQILWQEWQAAASAELAAVKLAGLRDRDCILLQQDAMLSERLRRGRAAVAAGDMPRTTADADLVALQTVRQKIADDSVARLRQRAALDALLGLAPTVKPRLAALTEPGGAGVAQAEQALDRLVRIRPDLMALRAAYASQEQTLREAVLAQFPSFSVGFTRARDTSNVNTLGFGVSFSLPMFNGSRGAIAVARATRRGLYDDYRMRLAQARADVQQAAANIALLKAQRVRLARALPALTRAAGAADAALAEGDLTLPQAQAQRMAVLDQRLALQSNAQQIAEQAVTLQLLTGRGVFGATPGPASAGDLQSAAP